MKRPSTSAMLRLETFVLYQARVDCALCKRTIPIGAAQLDHIQALIDGGAHDAMNLRPLCHDCHKVKSAFEHKRNSKSKRLSKARQAHDAIVKREAEKVAGSIKSRGFDKTRTKKFSGEVVSK